MPAMQTVGTAPKAIESMKVAGARMPLYASAVPKFGVQNLLPNWSQIDTIRGYEISEGWSKWSPFASLGLSAATH